MRISVSFKIPERYEKNFSKADSQSMKEFKEVASKELQAEFERLIIKLDIGHCLWSGK